MRSLLPLLLLACLSTTPAPAQTKPSPSKSQAAPQVWKVSPQVFKTKLGLIKGQLIDVRTPDEYTKGHITGSVMLDYLNPEFEKKIKTLDHNKPVFLYCASGGRSEEAAEAMRKAGFKQIYNLEGGYRDLVKAGMTSAQ